MNLNVLKKIKNLTFIFLSSKEMDQTYNLQSIKINPFKNQIESCLLIQNINPEGELMDELYELKVRNLDGRVEFVPLDQAVQISSGSKSYRELLRHKFDPLRIRPSSSCGTNS